ncbi:MAG: argininosuccinate synthase [Bacteroidetes bacterium 4572_117]|nr:MAG: argininosuccinate synthase [Bacteroidetes bacterium 4572_117]
MNKQKLVLAYSGGLDTSYIVKKFSEEEKYEVHTVLVNTGGFSKNELKTVEEKAIRLGAKSHKSIDIVDKYYEKCIKFLVYGNILKNNAYPLSVSSERTFQAIEIANYAKELGTNLIAHGSTGAGNDQVRFDLVFKLIIPDVQIITPVRDKVLSRETEINYLKMKGIDGDWAKSVYSINKGIWGTSIGGKETLSSNKTLPEHAYLNQLEEKEAMQLKLGFEKGQLVSINNDNYKNTVDAIHKLNEIGGKYAIGRGMHVGDTVIGSKGRVGFEAPAAVLIIESHRTLEKYVLSKWQMHWKEQLANWYGMLLHEAQYFEPVMRNIEKFLEDSQERVTGKVIIKLMPYRFEIEGIESDFDMLNSKFGSYGEENKLWTGEDVKGFTNILSNSMKIHQSAGK